MSLKKQFDAKKHVCKVTFTLAKNLTDTAKHINLAGDFNNWDIESIPMKKQKDGVFSVSVDLEKCGEYQFKYLLDGKVWINDKEADKQVLNDFKTKNSVVIV